MNNTILLQVVNDQQARDINAPLPPLILEGESDTNAGKVVVAPPTAVSDADVTNSPSKIRGGQGGVDKPSPIAMTKPNPIAMTKPSPIAMTKPSPIAMTGQDRIAARHIMNTEDMKALRRRLRSNGTPAEGGLWNILKGKKVGGLQFRRQYSVGSHILDFYCPALKLAIELDGEYHYYGATPEHDMARDEELMHNYGIQTMRFENKIVFQQPQAIVNSILEIQKKLAISPCKLSTPPSPL